MYNVRIYITPKKSIADPQGNAVRDALETMGFPGIDQVRIGKLVEIKLNGETREEVETEIKKMCKKLIVNTLIEEYTYEFVEESR